ncbi:DNA-3-methyladenine glycosylase 2 family protein [Paroceanicella profunda]|uniref:DNA-3-methyladenine glycosylase II n=1 Tax=Paroceanicella profunda TaxID=2579971 RepID=A0A5B8FI40_9RHOB|nr:DNA-3-methyladenine glycosylase [Paroceanicella profunda]QDL92648.1 DNA-3-methyladenine glycosylase 2 family protein [Paroceanicella profunda]
MTGRIIETDADVAEGAAWLARRDPRLAAVLARTGPLPLRRRADGFEALLNAIVGQQISTAAAAGIWSRLGTAGALTLEGIAALDDAALLGCGLSRPKLRYIRALADSGFAFEALRGMSDAEVVAALVSLKGIGRWTAEVYAMFSLGRADVFAAGDLALQESARLAFGLDARPGERALREMAQEWSPWRAVAARALWAYYRVAKQREGVRT